MVPDLDPVVKIIGLGGPSSSGKSTVARVLRRLLPHISIIYQDDFYLDDCDIPLADNGLKDWDCPEAFDLKKLSYLLQQVKETQEISPYYSKEDQNKIGPLPIEEEEFKVLQEKVNKSKLSSNGNQSSKVKLVLVDGIMLYQKDSPLIDLLDVKLLFRAPYKTLKKRREARSGYATIEGFWEDPPGYFDDIVWPQYLKTHGYLFKDGNVEDELTKEAQQDFHITTASSTSSEVNLMNTVDWVLDTIIRVL